MASARTALSTMRSWRTRATPGAAKNHSIRYATLHIHTIFGSMRVEECNRDTQHYKSTYFFQISLNEEAVHILLNSGAPLISTSDYYALLWWWFTKREAISKTWWSRISTKKAVVLPEAEEDTVGWRRLRRYRKRIHYFRCQLDCR